MESLNSGPGRLVFGDDGSPPADVAWSWIGSQRWPGWQVEVVTATEPPLAPPPATDEPVLRDWEPPSARQAPAEAGLAGIRYLTAVADPRVLLGRCRDADLLVIGSKGLNPLRALLVGSTTEWLLADPPSPLLVARSGDKVKTVMVAVDGSTHAHRAAVAFTRLPWSRETRSTVLVVDDGRIDEADIEDTITMLGAAGIETETRTTAGRPTDVIIQHIDRLTPDLAVMGSRGLTGLDRLRIGSTASAVVRHGGCSVLAAAD